MSLADPVPDLLAGSRFEILRSVGQGGMGVVYEAMDHERGRRIALKTLLSPEPDQLLRFKNEFRALQDIQHPNLVVLGELREIEGRLFFTMEFVDGVRFLRWVRPSSDEAAGELDEERLRDALRQLAAGLVALHDAGKVHCDIKPANVLVTTSERLTGRVVILDFGVVADANRKPDARTIAGTPNYMAPEQSFGLAVGRYSQNLSVMKALTLGFGGKVRDSFLRALALEPDHADAHLALGVYHAEVVDKVGSVVGALSHHARRDAVEHRNGPVAR